MGSHMDFKSLEFDGGRAQGNGFPLARQSSIYSLTFDELHSNFSGFGKDFGSMNMDELLKNIWPVEETKDSTSSVAVGCGSTIGGLQKLGSLTLPRTLSQKTVDQVWKDLYKEECSKVGDFCPQLGMNFQPRQATLGEMTLEEFLHKAGVVREDAQSAATFSNGGFHSMRPSTNSCVNLEFQQSVLNTEVDGRPTQQPVQAKTPTQPPLFPRPANVTFAARMQPVNRPQLPNIAPKRIMIGMRDTSVPNNGYYTQNGGMGLQPLAKTIPLDADGRNNAESSPLAPSHYGYSPDMRVRRGNAGVEKVVERRHRRMIKNRESASRSRARKQAYTLELEAEIAKLREVNEELHRKQDEMMEVEKDEVMEKIRLRCGGKPVCLRRTLTGPW